MIYKIKLVALLLLIYVADFQPLVHANSSISTNRFTSNPDSSLIHRTSHTKLNYVNFDNNKSTFHNAYDFSEQFNNSQSYNNDPFKIIVSTSTGLEEIDDSIELLIDPNDTLQQLKEKIRDQFRGNPPIFLQKLVFNNATIAYSPHTKLKAIKPFTELMSKDGVISLILDMFTVPISLKFNPVTSLDHSSRSRKLLAYLIIIDRLIRYIYFGIPDNSKYLNQELFLSPDDTFNQIQSDTLNKDLHEKIMRLKDFIERNNLVDDIHSLIDSFEITKESNNTLEYSNHNATTDSIKFPYTLNQRLFEKFSINCNIQWKSTSKLAILLLYLHHFGPDYEQIRKSFLFSIPIIFLIQTKPIRLARKILRNSLPRSNIWQGFNFILSTSQQELFK